MTGPKGSEFCFPETLNVSRGEAPVISLSALEKNCEEIVCFTPHSSQICRGFKEPDLITANPKFMSSFPRELVNLSALGS